jgi:hypothetical protein
MQIQDFNADAAYQQALAERVRAICAAASVELSLHQIVVQASGAYPSDVCAVLEALGISYQQGKSDSFEKRVLMAESTLPSYCNWTELATLFADPHPADYDWRFEQRTIHALASRLLVEEANGDGAGVALLGTKTVFPLLWPAVKRVTLFNKSQAILHDLRKVGYASDALVECDLRRPVSPELYRGYAVALADPPWYLDYYQAFMMRAAEMLHLGGLLYLSVLPKLTRPSAETDQAEILHYGTALGFALVRKEPGVLAYETPPFERNALQEKGISGKNWRRGDLWVWRKISEQQTVLTSTTTIEEPEWKEFRIGQQRIKIKQFSSEASEFSYEPSDIKNGSTLTQVSRRSSVRERIVVWSSDNKAFFVARPAVLERCLKEWPRYGSISGIASFLQVQDDITQCEQQSILALLGELIQ